MHHQLWFIYRCTEINTNQQIILWCHYKYDKKEQMREGENYALYNIKPF